MSFKVPEDFSDISSPFKELVNNEEISTIVLTCFTYLLIVLGIIMILKLYFQTVFIFSKYFPIVTLPLYVLGAWAFSALLFYMAWDLGNGVPVADENSDEIIEGGDEKPVNTNNYIMKYTYAALLHQGLIIGGVFLLIAPFTLLMPRLRFGRSSSDNAILIIPIMIWIIPLRKFFLKHRPAEGCCKTICFPTFVWVVFLFIVILVAFSGYCLYSLLTEYYQLSVFMSMGVEGIYVLLVLFYLFALFQILAQRKVIVSGENILGELRKPFKCLHSRPYLFTYLSILVFFALLALAVTAYYFVLVFQQYEASEEKSKTDNLAIVGAFSAMACVYVLIALVLGLVISCSKTIKSPNPASTYAPQPTSGNDYGDQERASIRNNQPYSTATENMNPLNDQSSYQQRESNDYNATDTLDSRNNTLQYNDGTIRSTTLELKPVNQNPKTVAITMQHSDGSKSNLGAIRAFPHTTLADARILTRTLPNAPQNYVFITRNREVSESQEADFTIYGLDELILAVETVC